ncbi:MULTISPECIES: hypothetical protein [Promicromonospora]|uniref:Helix-turn-helix transcriptional regulator n=2 Tax=Promicromonospora TaxID=43676 RepID=A0ABP8Y257_9MICO|nr:hypothetical protein [Promicromonospora umidemergens]
MANGHLRRRREATLSPSGSGLPMTRAELAASVNQYVWKTTGKHCHLDVDTLARYERGQIRWPRAMYRDGLRAVLGVETNAELGFFPTRRGKTAVPGGPVQAARQTVASAELAEPVDRRQFLQTLTAASLSVSLDGFARELEVLAPARVVSEADIARLRSVGEFFTSWAHVHGGQELGHAVSAEMSSAVDLLKTSCPPRLRPHLSTAVGQLGVAMGSLLFDAHQHQLAARILAFATQCAEAGNDWNLRAKALSWRARQAVWIGDVNGGRSLAQLGLVHADRLTPTERAMLHTAVARAQGRLGDVQATLRAIGAADDAFADADPANDVPWMTYYDHAQHSGDTGHALHELAVHGVEVEEATSRLATAVAEHPDAYIRSRAFSGFKLAALTMRTGDPNQATKIAEDAVRDAEGVRSLRVRRTALEIVAPAQRHRASIDVARLLISLETVGTAA